MEGFKALSVAFDSGVKFKITLLLLNNPNKNFTKYSIVKSTGIKTRIVDNYLKDLLNIGWIKKFEYTPITYKINKQNRIVLAFIGFLKEIKTYSLDKKIFS